MFQPSYLLIPPEIEVLWIILVIDTEFLEVIDLPYTDFDTNESIHTFPPWIFSPFR